MMSGYEENGKRVSGDDYIDEFHDPSATMCVLEVAGEHRFSHFVDVFEEVCKDHPDDGD